MIKRAMPFLMIAVVFLMTSCGTSTSPQSEYASQLAPALEMLSKFQDHYVKFESLLTEPVSGAGGSGMSRLDMIELYNLATEYNITREDYVTLGFMPLDMLVGESNKLAREGTDILAILSDVTPEASVQTIHQAVLQCVQTRVDFAESLATSIKNLGPVELSGDASVCSTFDADLEKITSYVSDNK